MCLRPCWLIDKWLTASGVVLQIENHFFNLQVFDMMH